MHHRSHRKDPTTWIRPLPRKPATSEGASLRTADTYLTEDTLDSMYGVLTSIDALAKAVIEQCSQLWLRRRINPTLLPQPASQWAPPPAPANFDGYNPRTAQQVFDDAGFILVHPSEGKRLAALTDEQR
uniref:hypothetical protein n=1 Tax=Rhodococcus qingshengii TaxID=334542 RepID=UPI001C4E1F7C|nr:hypothetical protein [Rhodococcus qingshengii]